MDTLINALVNGLVVPVASLIPVLVESGVLLLVFAALWIGFGGLLLRRRSSLDDAWLRLRALPLPVQGLAWLLFLPVLVGLAVWRTAWPLVTRLAVIAGLAGWNLLVFVPRPA